MTDARYQYEKVNAVKIIVVSNDDKVLLIKEPEFNEWMPGHWGLPGGKAMEKESLLQTFNRKAKNDLGKELKLLGIFKIEELLIEGKTALMFHVVAGVELEFIPEGEIAGYKWVSVEEVEKMDLAEFTEFFNKKLLLEFLKGDRKLIDFGVIDTLDYFNKSTKDSEYIRWFNSGQKK